MKSILLIITIALASTAFCQKKTPILERRISVSFYNERLPDALARVAHEGGFSFSYSPALIKESQLISLRAVDKSVREVLTTIFKGSLTFKEKGEHLILVQPPQRDLSNKVVVISGYVEDAQTKEKIAKASVYDKKTITSAVTDDFGYFTMKLDKGQSGSIAVSKKNYQDTVVAITAPDDQYITVSIAPVAKDSLKVTAVTSDSVTKEERHIRMPYDENPNVLNIRDTLYRPVQVSFVPFIGTNGLLSGNVINDYSINILGGYSLGVKRVEVAGMFNLDRGDVSFLQLAGMGNAVRGGVNGFQAAGLFNVNGGSVNAVQGAGYFNLNFKDFTGVEIAGFANINLGTTHGVMLAGFTNVAKGPSGGTQIAGFNNIATGEYTGSQVSGFFNYARKLKGSQLALFNYADSLSGVPIGLFSYVKHGYHKLEISSDEIFYANVAFRSGIKKFYSIHFAGMKPKPASDNQTVWTFGYGFGTAPTLTKWLDLNIDLTSQQINKGSFTDKLSLLSKLYLGLDCKLAKKLSITGGVTLNAYFTKNDYADYATIFTDYHPHVFSEHNYNNHTNIKMWLGAKVGIRF